MAHFKLYFDELCLLFSLDTRLLKIIKDLNLRSNNLCNQIVILLNSKFFSCRALARGSSRKHFSSPPPPSPPPIGHLKFMENVVSAFEN